MEFFLILGTVIVWGLSPIFDKMALKTVDPIVMLSLRMMTSGFILFAYLSLNGKTREIFEISLKSTSFIFISACLSGVLGYTFYFKALAVGEASRVVPSVTCYPLVVAIISILFLGESFTIQKILGIVFIVSGAAMLNIK